jgi:hypothetical protein
MRRLMTYLMTGALLLTATGARAQQVEIDRTLQRVGGTPIMLSDVREARLLKLVPEAGGSDDAILTALENRLLMLSEASRMPANEPAPELIAARRQAWRATWPAGTDVPALMVSAGTTDQDLDGWFRDDLRIATYLDQRFGQAMDATRTKRVSDWLVELRRRANLIRRGGDPPPIKL